MLIDLFKTNQYLSESSTRTDKIYDNFDQQIQPVQISKYVNYLSDDIFTEKYAYFSDHGTNY